MNRGERVPDGVNQWTGEPLNRCPWCGWRFCDCPKIIASDTWAGDLTLITLMHRHCAWDRCSGHWVARNAEPLNNWNCPWFEPSRTEAFRRLENAIT